MVWTGENVAYDEEVAPAAGAEPEAEELDLVPEGRFAIFCAGGATAQTPEDRQARHAAWQTWLRSMGNAVVDASTLFGPSVAITSGGQVRERGAMDLTGYAIISATTISVAIDLAKGCPVLANGGNAEVYEQTVDD